MEKLATEWPGRVVALWDEQPGSAEGATVPIPGTSTLLVPNNPSNWDETARRVADAAHGRASAGSVDLGPLLL